MEWSWVGVEWNNMAELNHLAELEQESGVAVGVEWMNMAELKDLAEPKQEIDSKLLYT